MLQNKLLLFDFELKIHVRRMENISFTEICRLLVSREVGGVRPMILPMSERLHGLWMCPFYSGQVMDRCACSGSSCLNPFYDMFMTCYDLNLRQFTSQAFWGGNKNMCLKIFHTWESLTCEIYFIGVLLISKLVFQS